MSAPTPLSVFTALADDVHRRMDEGAALPDAACAALEAAQLHEHVSHEAIFRWVVSTAELPEQRIDTGFGEPPIEVYRDEDFYIQVLTWMDGTTAIHQHGFSGAFCVLEGSSCHTRYTFEETSRPCDALRLGVLRYHDVDFLTQGSCRSIEPGSTFIHALFHLERPSVSVVVRNGREADHQPQWSYDPPGLAYNPFELPDALERRRAGPQAMKALSMDAAHEALARRLEVADLHEAWYLLRTVVLGSPLTEALKARFVQLERRHGEAGRAVVAGLMVARRIQALKARRELVHDAEDRWLMAILLNVPSRGDALALIAARYPGVEPVTWLLERLEALSQQPAPPEFGGSTLGLVFDDLTRELCGELLRGSSSEEAIAQLAAREGADPGDALWLRHAEQMLRQSHILGQLLA